MIVGLFSRTPWFSAFLLASSFSAATQAATHTVEMQDNFFSPDIVDINVGDRVVWVNEGINPHSTTADSGLWDSEEDFPGGLFNGDTFGHTFNVAGEFSYYDNGFAGMLGLVRVQSSNPAPTASIANLTNGAAFVATTNLVVVATASDPGGSIGSVQFLTGTTPIGVDSTSPYSITNSFAAGVHVLSAVATDNLGARGTSAPVKITLTAPLNFELTKLRLSGAMLSLTISSTPGLQYALEAAPSLPAANWMAVATNSATSNSLSFSNSTPGSARFFRARLVP